MLLTSRGVRHGSRVTAVLALTSLVLAWGLAQRPYLLPTSLTVADGAGDPDTLRWLLVVTAVAVVVVAPALAVLYRLDLSDRLRADHDADLIEDTSTR
jgi:cytochrome d ubiquinol oxidase subunit II